MSDDSGSDEPTVRHVVRKPVDLQRLKLEKLMKNPEKPVYIPEPQKDKKFPDAPEFVRNVMGSSAGAGSGEFHVYRHIRRREYARNIHLQTAKEKVVLDEEYHKKLEQNKREAEEKTSRKRAKRQKWKMKKLQKKIATNKSENKNKQESQKQSESEDHTGSDSSDSSAKSQ